MIHTTDSRVAMVYVYPLDGQQGFAPRAAEFVASYVRNPPGMDHQTVIVCNGAVAAQSSRDLFNPLPNVTFIDHDNSGWDIGAFQLAARTVPCQLMVFCGSHTYFRKPGWMVKMCDAALGLGDTLYGSTGNQGNIGVGVYPHVRTTGFWCSPALMAAYPHLVSQTGGGGQRYEMEHGKSCMSNWVKQMGRTPWIVGWDDIKSLDTCDSMVNGYHQGNQDNLLVGDRLCAPPYYHTP